MVLEAKELYCTLEGRQVLRGVTFALKQGEILGLTGDSGSGKTTLVKTLLGLHRRPCVVSGSVVLEPRTAALVFQNSSSALNPFLKVQSLVAESVRIGSLGLPRTDVAREVCRLLEAVCLDKTVAKLYPHELSAGMQQRVQIASVLALKPKVLIADELTSALDKKSQTSILELLKQLQQSWGLSILFITHDVPESFCDRVLVMERGKILP